MKQLLGVYSLELNIPPPKNFFQRWLGNVDQIKYWHESKEEVSSHSSYVTHPKGYSFKNKNDSGKTLLLLTVWLELKVGQTIR